MTQISVSGVHAVLTDRKGKRHELGEPTAGSLYGRDLTLTFSVPSTVKGSDFRTLTTWLGEAHTTKHIDPIPDARDGDTVSLVQRIELSL